jgi:hypothetical protein
MLLVLACVLVPVVAKAADPPPPPPPPSGILYATVDDGTPTGTEIAIQEFYPTGFNPDKDYPALVEVEGYGGASSPNDNSFVATATRPQYDYVVVAISIRGTGCSAGQLDLFSQRSSQDIAWIIDNWIPDRFWSNDLVGIYGHSYGGLTGFLVAAEVPDTTHLKAVAVSGLIDDFYRGILYPGGISNYGFPVLWGAVSRPLSEHQANGSYIVSPNQQGHCAANYAQHRGTDAVPQAALFADTYGSPYTENPVTQEPAWAIRNALMTHIADIKAPIQLGQQYQDEQTGPRGGHVLWENIPANVPKRIQISTGMHNPNDPKGNKRDWLDCWVLFDGAIGATATSGKTCAEVRDPAKRVQLYFESKGSDRLAAYTAADWPLPNTDWRRYFLRADGTLAQSAGPAGEVVYASTGNGRHTTGNFGRAFGTPSYPGYPAAPVPLPTPTSPPPLSDLLPPVPDPYNRTAPLGFTTGLPDTARYTLDFAADTALAGPLELSLWAKISSTDTDFWAEILDYDTATGATTFVQRGLLRASFNATFDDSDLSQKTPGGDIYRPYYSYLSTTPVVPNTPVKYEVEIFPLGHVWRAGHQLVLQLHAPPASDPISIYAYEPSQPSVVTILQGEAYPTSILLPFMPVLPPIRGTAPACGEIVGELCITPALG